MKSPSAAYTFAPRPLILAALALVGGSAARAQDATPSMSPPATSTAQGQTAPLPDAPPAPLSITNGDAKADAAAARIAARRAMMEARMRDLMTRTGISAVATQDAILEFVRNDEENKRTVREAGRNLWNGVRRDAPAERLHALLADYQKAIEEARQSRLSAQTALDARVGYSLDARLESLLWLFGVLGEGQIVMLPPSAAPRTEAVKPATVTIQAAPPIATDPDERPIEGIVAAKSAPDDVALWLEVKDEGGRVWHLCPADEPAARDILSRQIAALVVGARVLVRAGTLNPGQGGTVANADAPLVLLAIVPRAVTPPTPGEGDTTPLVTPYK